MAEKKFKIVVLVDLDCCRCKKKIRKVVSKLQDRENIDTVVYDEKDNKVTITGPFDAERLSRKLRCKASKCIKGIEIIEVKPAPEPKPKQRPEPKPETKKEPPPPLPPKREVVWVVCCLQPCPCHQGKMAPCCYCRCKKAAHEEEKKAPCCCHLCKKDKKAPCCWQSCPCSHGFPYHGCHCCSFGQDDGCSPPPQPEKPPPVIEKPPPAAEKAPPTTENAPPPPLPPPCPPYPCPPYPCQIVYVEDPPNPCVVM